MKGPYCLKKTFDLFFEVCKRTVEQVRRVYDDNLGIIFCYFSIKTYVVCTG